MVNLKIFSVSEYVEYLNVALYERDAVVEGEISEYKVNQQKWVFFKLKDETTLLECFSIVFKLKFPLEDGMRVRLYGRPRIHPKSGKFSMNVEWAEPAGEGSLKRAFELLKAELQKEGLFAPERKRLLPRFPKRIGLITSRESAAHGDFVKILKQRFGGIEIHLFHTQVQGSDAIADIVGAFSHFNAEQKNIKLDCIALIRGGGSMEDLAAFNTREVAYAIFGSLVPVVSGVGHEQDETIADYVADVRASTPSNAAELIAPDRADLIRHFSRAENAMINGIKGISAEARSAVDDCIVRLDAVALARSHAFSALEQKFLFQLNFFKERIILQQSKIDHAIRLMKSFSPHAVLERGYALVKRGEKVITSAKDLVRGDSIGLTFKDGSREAEIV